MDLPRNAFKHALKAGKPQIGLWSSLSSNYSVEVIAGAGFDWLLLDMEHSPNDLESLLAQLQAAAPYATHPVVRVPWNDMVTIKRVLDVGAQSLLVPYVSTAEEARAAVSFTRYPPKGVRGVAGTTRATRFGRVKDYARRAHEELCLLVQVETQAALDSIEAICAIDGVDGVFIGPADLHASLGYAGEIANPKVMPVIDDAIRRIRKAGKAPGILTPSEGDARRWLDCGALFVAVGADAGIIVTNTPDVLNETVADTALALILNTVRRFPQSEQYLRGGNWAARGAYALTTDIGGKTLGVLGLGRIGEAIAKRAQACGMKIRYHNRRRKDSPYPYDADPVTLAKNSNVLLVVTPGGPQTNN